MGKYCGSVDVDTTLREVGTYCESGFCTDASVCVFLFSWKLSYKYTAKAVIL